MMEEYQESNENNREELLKQYEAVSNKDSLCKEDWEFLESVKNHLYEEEKMNDEQIAEVLGLQMNSIRHWRYRRGLPQVGKEERKTLNTNNHYSVTEKELQLVREFVIKYIARKNGRGGNFSLEQIRSEIMP